MQRARFAHQRSTIPKIKSEPDWPVRSTEAIHQRPMGPFFGRLFHGNDNEVAAGPFWDHVGGGEMTFLPTVGLLGEFSFGIVNVDGNLPALHFRSHPKPIFVA